MTMIASPHRATVVLAAAVWAAATVTSVADGPAARAALAYGAISYSGSGAGATVWNYPSRDDAEQTANKYCGYTDCTVLTSFTDCGAVASNGKELYGGHGPTLIAAAKSARANLGGGWIDSWACNTI